MKRILIGFLLAGVYILVQVQDAHAAQARAAGEGCDGHKDTVTFPLGDYKDIGISGNAEKIAPSNVIVIGQDPETMRGVDLSVTITALPGTATFWRKHRYEIGEYFPWPKGDVDKIPDGYECSPSTGRSLSCVKVEYRCEPVTETVYRYINPDSVSIWLDPTIETEQFLGWAPTPGGRYPLRYLFPEKWALGAWTPTGLETADIREWYPTGEEVWAFGQANPWFTYLFPDPNETNLPGQHLIRVSQPHMDSEYISRRVLALYGSFYTYQSQAYSEQSKETGPRLCLVDSNSLPASDTSPASIGTCDPADGEGFGNNVIYVNVIFKNIPLDLPGTWRIGMKATQKPAMYDQDRLPENPSPSWMTLSFGPSAYKYSKANYDIDKLFFDSYVIVSTPCYGTDPKSCKN